MRDSTAIGAKLRRLAALHLVAAQSEATPIRPTIQLRAILWLLYAASDGDRDSNDAFLSSATATFRIGYSECGDRYYRRTILGIHLFEIGRSLGFEPLSPGFGVSLARLCASDDNNE